MDILFKRAQGKSQSGNVNFKLWSKIELDEGEQEIISKYKFDQAVLIDSNQQGLLRQSIMIGGGLFIVGFALFFKSAVGILVTFVAAIAAGYFWYDRNRETIFVKDLLHGRNFTCKSVIDLAQKEVRIGDVASVFRQVMESAKQWDGTEQHSVEALSPEEARRLIARAF